MFNREKNVYAVTNAYLIENICNNLRLPLCPLPIVSYYFTKNTFFMQILRKKKIKNEIEHLSVVIEIIMKVVMTTSNIQ